MILDVLSEEAVTFIAFISYKDRSIPQEFWYSMSVLSECHFRGPSGTESTLMRWSGPKPSPALAVKGMQSNPFIVVVKRYSALRH